MKAKQKGHSATETPDSAEPLYNSAGNNAFFYQNSKSVKGRQCNLNTKYKTIN